MHVLVGARVSLLDVVHDDEDLLAALVRQVLRHPVHDLDQLLDPGFEELLLLGLPLAPRAQRSLVEGQPRAGL